MAKQLIIGIDLQEGFLNDEIKQSDYRARVETFLASHDNNSIILSRFVNEPNSNFVRLMDWSEMQQSNPSIMLFGNLEEQGYEVVTKGSYTSWLPQMQQKAEKIGATDIVIFGLDSDACVFKTALDIFEAGYRPIVLADLCQNSGGEERNQTGLTLLKILIGEDQVINSSELTT